MEKRNKVLHVLGGMGRGGAPSFIINNMKKTNAHKLEYDFLVRKDNCAFNEEIKEHGGKIFIVPEFPQKLIANYIETRKFFKEHKGEYIAVHIHANALLYMLPIRLAITEWNCKVIVHSHNTQSNIKGLSYIHKFNRRFRLPDNCIRLACGKEAGRWMYGDKSFEVINNAIDASKFRYSENDRTKIRKELGIKEDAFVVGNVGRFENAKNHSFMIDIFIELLKRNNNSILLLVGDGSLKDNIETKVRKSSIEGNVIFTGNRSDTSCFYSAFDAFLMPSLFEGLPFTLVEAQVAGLPCIVSQNITSEVDLTNLVHRRSLDDSPSEWANSIINAKQPALREEYVDQIKSASYDTGVTAKRLQEIYLCD